MLGMVDFSMIPVYFTDEVKLLHGSASLSESSGALGGVIQLENIPNWNNTLSGKLFSGIGSYNTFDEYLQFNTGNRKIQSKSSFFHNSSSNDFQFVNKLNAAIDPVSGNYIYSIDRNRNADYRNYGFLQEFYLHVRPNQTISLKSWLQHNERSIPQLLTNESNSSSNLNRQYENSFRSVAEWKRFGNASRFSWKMALNLQNTAYKAENSVSGASNQIVVNSDAKILSIINKLDYRYQLSKELSLAAGMEADFHKILSNNLLLHSGINIFDKSRKENSFFAEMDAKLNPNWHALVLLREYIIDLKHSAFIPMARLSYLPDPDKTLILYGAIARNDHPPTLNDLYYVPGGNPNLKSENGIQADLGLSNDFSIENQMIHAGISLFRSTVNNWIIWLPTFQGYWEPTNVEKVVSNGIEANAKWSGQAKAIRYELKLNYAFTSTTNRSEGSPVFGKQLPYIPKNSANLNLHLSYSGAYLDWMWNYYSKRYTTTSNSEDTISDYLYSYFMNNVQIGKSFAVGGNKLTAECKVLNIFNEDYRTVLQRPMPGRNYQFVLYYDF
jgi:iron complex outermembrane receptor protein